MHTENNADVLFVDLNARDGSVNVTFVRREDFSKACFNPDTWNDSDVFIFDIDGDDNETE